MAQNRNSTMLSPLAIARMLDGTERHVISEISYPNNEVICTCGWMGESLDPEAFRQHRRSVVPADTRGKRHR